MGLKAILESLEGVDDAVAKLYAPAEGGKYRLDIEGGFKTPAEVEGLTSALGKERAASAEAQKKLKDFEGIDPATARDALKKVDTWGEDSQKAAEKLEAELQQRLQPVTAERDKYKALAEERSAQIDNFTIDAALRGAKAFEKVEDPIYRESLMVKVRDSLKMVDGKLVGFKPDGQQVFDSNANPATGEDLIAKIVDSIPNVQMYFSGSRATGSGATPGGAMPKAGASTPKSYAECKTEEERVAYLENPQNLKVPNSSGNGA